jgi:hypothetical protein
MKRAMKVPDSILCTDFLLWEYQRVLFVPIRLDGVQSGFDNIMVLYRGQGQRMQLSSGNHNCNRMIFVISLRLDDEGVMKGSRVKALMPVA